MRNVRKRGKAWTVPYGNVPPKPPKGFSKWYVLRLCMGIVGRELCEKGLPGDARLVPSFAMVATDRVAAKNEVWRLLDEMFDAFDECEKAK
jgi:hypothetical protein